MKKRILVIVLCLVVFSAPSAFVQADQVWLTIEGPDDLLPSERADYLTVNHRVALYYGWKMSSGWYITDKNYTATSIAFWDEGVYEFSRTSRAYYSEDVYDEDTSTKIITVINDGNYLGEMWVVDGGGSYFRATFSEIFQPKSYWLAEDFLGIFNESAEGRHLYGNLHLSAEKEEGGYQITLYGPGNIPDSRVYSVGEGVYIRIRPHEKYFLLTDLEDYFKGLPHKTYLPVVVR